MARSSWKAEGEEWRMEKTYSHPRVKNGERRKRLVRRFYHKAFVFHRVGLYTKASFCNSFVLNTPKWSKHVNIANTRVIPILHSPRTTIGVSHLSPRRSHPIGSSFSSFSHSPILRGGVTTPNVLWSSSHLSSVKTRVVLQGNFKLNWTCLHSFYSLFHSLTTMP